MSNTNNNPTFPQWMASPDYPIQEIRDAVQHVQQQEKKIQSMTSSSSGNSSNNEKNPLYIEGTVLLVWKEKGNDAVTTEQDKFPTKSSFYIAQFQDYTSKSEMEEIVISYQKFVSEYNQLPNKSGAYAIVLGKMVKTVEMKQTIIETIDIQFE